jgi:hypothetical protein
MDGLRGWAASGLSAIEPPMVEASAGDWQMRGKHGFAKRVLVLGGLLMGTASMALVPTAANARNFIGVDLGPLSVGIGPNTPDYVYVPAPAPVPSEMTPPTSYSPPPVGYQTPTTSYQAPTSYQVPTTNYPAPSSYQAPTVSTQAPTTTTMTTTTYYFTYPSTTTYYSYRPGYYVAPTETATTYYGQ